MTDNFIQLEEENILRLGIKDSQGNDTGNVLEFDFDDMDFPIRIQSVYRDLNKLKSKLINDLKIIEKRPDIKKRKNSFSKNEEDAVSKISEFFKETAKLYNKILGENGVEKLLNGRNLGWTTIPKIDKMIETQIMPYFNKSVKKEIEEIKGTYKIPGLKDNEVIE